MAAPEATPHRWRFVRAGGFDQVKLQTGADLLHLGELDQKLWVALACPVAGLEFDSATAALIDSDHDGRIRPPELVAAITWAGALLRNPDELIKGGDVLPLAGINDAIPEGALLLAAASRLAPESVSLAQVMAARERFVSEPLNGDGIVTLDSTDDEALRRVIGEIMAAAGSVADLSGKPGIGQEQADRFFAAAAAFGRWSRAGEGNPALRPLGEATGAALEAVRAIEAKADDFFARCRLAAFDARAGALLSPGEQDYAALASKPLRLDATEAAALPLARIAPDAPLPLQGSVNPAHAAALAALREHAVKPLLGERAEISETGWRTLLAQLKPYRDWQSAKAGGAVESLGEERVRALLGGQTQAAVNALIARDQSVAGQAAALAQLEKLIRYQRDLRVLCENFVNFKDLYSGQAPAIFQAGVLYLDQRACHFCLKVEDAAKHAAMAGLAGAYLAYVDCARLGGAEKLTVAALFSQGDDENLMVGRNGVFYARSGHDYDATITKVLPNPISLRQAFWLPYKKAARFIEELVTRRASAASAQTDSKLAAAGASATVTPSAGRKPLIDLSVIALVSVACGSLAGAFVSGLDSLAAWPAWKLPFLVLAVIALISGPSLILAYIKLRRRNLAPILDASGWAINARAKINVPFATRLTSVAHLPPRATIDLHDRYAQRTPAWPRLLLAIFLLWWIYAILVGNGFIRPLSAYLAGYRERVVVAVPTPPPSSPPH